MLDPDYLYPKMSFKFISALSIILVGMGAQQNFFPIYTELKTKTKSQLTSSVALANIAVTLFYSSLALVGIYTFGSAITHHSTILLSIGAECTDHPSEPCPRISVLLRLIFMIVVAAHIPFIFFSGKEGILIVVDEVDRRSVSRALEFKMRVLEEE